MPANQVDSKVVLAARTFLGHKDGVWNLSMSRDGKRALSASYDRTVRLWDVASGKELLQLTGHDGPVLGVAFLPDGQSCVTCSADGTIRTWSLKSGKETGRIEAHRGGVQCLALAADGKTMVSAGADGLVKLWDRPTGKLVRNLAENVDWIWSLAISPDGKRALGGSADKSARLWEIATGKEIHRLLGHQQAVTCVAFTPDGKRAVTGSSDESLRLWNLDNGQSIRHIHGHKGPIYAVAIPPGGRQIISGGADGIIRVWDDIESSPPVTRRGLGGRQFGFDQYGNPIATDATHLEMYHLEGHEGAVYCLCLSPDGTALLSGGRDTSIRLWELRGSGAELHRLQGHDGPVAAAAFSPDGARAVTASANSVRLWDVDKGVLLKKLDRTSRGTVRGVAFLPDGKRVFFHTSTGDLLIWNTDASNAEARLVAHAGTTIRSSSLVLTRDGKRALVGGADGKIHIWELETGKELPGFVQHTRILGRIALLPDGREAISCCLTSRGGDAPEEKVIRRWNVETLKEVNTYPIPDRDKPITSLAVSPDGQGFLVGSRDGITWRSLRQNGSSRDLALAGGPFTALAWVANDRFVTAGADGVLRLWDLPWKKELQQLGRGVDLVSELTYSPAKNLLLSASRDRTARIWKLPSPGSGPPRTGLGIFDMFANPKP